MHYKKPPQNCGNSRNHSSKNSDRKFRHKAGTGNNEDTAMSNDEEQVYVAGYVPIALLKQYQKCNYNAAAVGAKRKRTVIDDEFKEFEDVLDGEFLTNINYDLGQVILVMKNIEGIRSTAEFGGKLRQAETKLKNRTAFPVEDYINTLSDEIVSSSETPRSSLEGVAVGDSPYARGTPENSDNQRYLINNLWSSPDPKDTGLISSPLL
uniref:Uncharacterized protein n=1 Tax=Branchiostoma floridae TaxID=7739 RepID=C3ZC44_BRAFL|eukprot:XP_002593805.1 hypothetical protein BRAFLDRAFT_75736 [Branchiostoma floridae]